MTVHIFEGFDAHDRKIIATLYWSAFSGKLGALLGPDARALRFLETVLCPDFALDARDHTGTVLGVAGTKTRDGALVGGTFSDLAKHYGWFGATWRGVLLDQLERPVSEGELLMDGICVAQTARGKGVGSALLKALKTRARDEGFHTIRLDVINTNPRALALYERSGFTAGAPKSVAPFQRLFGFDYSTPMHFAVAK